MLTKFLISITPTINNLFICINNLNNGKLYKVFKFSDLKIFMAEHKRKKVFASEFGLYFGTYLTKVSKNKFFTICVNGLDKRSIAFLKSFCGAFTGSISQILIKQKLTYNGCRAKKRKRL